MSTVKELQQKTQEIMKQIEEIQEACPHPSFTVQMYQWRAGGFTPMRICNECSKPTGATREETEKCWDEYDKKCEEVQTAFEEKSGAGSSWKTGDMKSRKAYDSAWDKMMKNMNAGSEFHIEEVSADKKDADEESKE